MSINIPDNIILFMRFYQNIYMYIHERNTYILKAQKVKKNIFLPQLWKTPKIFQRIESGMTFFEK